MNALLKYELRKTRAMKLIFLGITAVAELVFLISLYLRNDKGNTDNIIGTSALLLMFIAIGGILLIGVQSIITLHRDMNTKQGYMLYMTPRNSYQILGAKMLENGLSLALAGGFFFLLGMLDLTLLFSRLGELERLWGFFMEFLHMFNAEIELDTAQVLSLILELLTSWLAVVSIAFLADIVSSALLNGKKANGIVTFIFFILLTILLNVIQNLLRKSGLCSTITSTLIMQSIRNTEFQKYIFRIIRIVLCISSNTKQLLSWELFVIMSFHLPGKECQESIISCMNAFIFVITQQFRKGNQRLNRAEALHPQ